MSGFRADFLFFGILLFVVGACQPLPVAKESSEQPIRVSQPSQTPPRVPVTVASPLVSSWQVQELKTVLRDEVRALAVNPKNPRHILFSTAQNCFVSRDGGLHWQKSVQWYHPSKQSHEAFFFSPENPEHVFWVGDTELDESKQGGSDWGLLPQEETQKTEISPLLLPVRWSSFVSELPIEQILASHGDPQIWYGIQAANSSQNGKLWKSQNAGKTWQEVQAGTSERRIIAFWLDPFKPDSLYLQTDQGIFLSSDQGANWELWNQQLGPAPKPHDPWVFDPLNAEHILVNAGGLIYESQDQGKTFKAWQNLPGKVMTSPQFVKEPAGGFFVGTDQGVFFWNGEVWEDRNGFIYREGFQFLAFYPDVEQQVVGVLNYSQLFSVDLNTQKLVLHDSNLGSAQVLKFSPDAPYTLYVGTSSGLWATQKLHPLRDFQYRLDTSVTPLPDSRNLTALTFLTFSDNQLLAALSGGYLSGGGPPVLSQYTPGDLILGDSNGQNWGLTGYIGNTDKPDQRIWTSNEFFVYGLWSWQDEQQTPLLLISQENCYPNLRFRSSPEHPVDMIYNVYFKELPMQYFDLRSFKMNLAGIQNFYRWCNAQADLRLRVVLPGSQKTWALTQNGQLFQGTVRPETWKKVGVVPGCEDPSKDISFSDKFLCQTLLLDPRDPNRLYAGNGKSVVMSSDGGWHWQELANFNAQVLSLVMSPRPPYRILAGTETGLYLLQES
ncbi:hypothetical protein COW36_21550 [bacterium (Candidatus Blackallbacteria) CG17_big_fil_post_rev_8_21_14_2_50_48_46]|uniref:Sortilin N-terminal domain-containing protein n=1 Tax=bacterium (Candidatus Blackallbacteria) CG17_big_fil_post_rev_8_21_14_2_50_48_46 TaxID=2014261 RepID=A0A2M7FZG1_9BACT|nr:MAG: hypothetical protein COW64_14850 [bacterium (Candidatus Blackallbacteria) CG18_big_fil_WC_8_21_14_2_50_49_26]PIW14625.1 MAG: hypothetical protein COW36_21550 [bacterium (Candidatus Blackallbacteria) CG17_big_fil_post_rev_8_21_14_2_50_48_46]PIW45676.1 MAG: hypothetical protein COW20_19380 [bacterium (Candidatus Blackallbacteria) CG13_big_fil_rev_8_21_14_2_50_49_14]